jgi:hypothetical protein
MDNLLARFLGIIFVVLYGSMLVNAKFSSLFFCCAGHWCGERFGLESMDMGSD